MRNGWRSIWSTAEKNVVEILVYPEYSYMHTSSMMFICDIAEGLEALSENNSNGETWIDNEPAIVKKETASLYGQNDPWGCLLYTSPSPRDATLSRMPSSA